MRSAIKSLGCILQAATTRFRKVFYAEDGSLQGQENCWRETRRLPPPPADVRRPSVSGGAGRGCLTQAGAGR